MLSLTTNTSFHRSSTQSSSEGLIENNHPIMPEDTDVNEERKVSYGIGGAGNIRKPSEPPNHTHVTQSHPEDGDTGRRRSSLLSTFSSSPPSERRGSLMNIFRRGSNGEETVETKSQNMDAEGGSKMDFREVDLSGKKAEHEGQGIDGVH